jgi:hypothetical protein
MSIVKEAIQKCDDEAKIASIIKSKRQEIMVQCDEETDSMWDRRKMMDEFDLVIRIEMSERNTVYRILDDAILQYPNDDIQTIISNFSQHILQEVFWKLHVSEPVMHKSWNLCLDIFALTH